MLHVSNLKSMVIGVKGLRGLLTCLETICTCIYIQVKNLHIDWNTGCIVINTIPQLNKSLQQKVLSMSKPTAATKL